MEYAELTAKVEKQNAMLQRVTDLLAEAQSDGEFVKQWLKERDGSLWLGTGFDDDNQHTYICIIPKVGRTDLAAIYLSLTQIKISHPEVIPISSYIVKESLGKYQHHLDLDDKRRRALEEKLGISYQDDLAERLGKFDAVYEFALSYAIDNGGEVNIGPEDKEFLFEDYEPEDESLLDTPLFCCDMHYQSPENVEGLLPGFGEAIFFKLE